MKNIFFKYGFTALFALLYTLPLIAQDPGTGGTDDEDPDPAAPIDNWVLLLVLAGIALGVYFVMKYRNNKQLA